MNLQNVTLYEAMGLSHTATSPHIQINLTFIEHLLHTRLSDRYLARYWKHMPNFLKSLPSQRYFKNVTIIPVFQEKVLSCRA